MKRMPRFLPAGDKALVVEFGSVIDESINARVMNLHETLLRFPVPGIVELVPTYRSLLVHYDPRLVMPFDLIKTLRGICATTRAERFPSARTVTIPVVYGGAYGPDIEFVARHNRLDVEELIRIHSGSTYRVYMLGFSPGFPYLGGMSARIRAPRLETPRSSVPSGSVGIALDQTGIYSVESPGGWRIIGRTALRLFDPGRGVPILLQAGDSLRFTPVDADEFSRIERGGPYPQESFP